MPVVHGGLRILGVPVGSDEFCEAFAESRLDDLEDNFETLGRMPHLQSQFVIAQRSLSHRVTHLLRTLHHAGDPRYFPRCRARYDDLMRRVPLRAVGRVGLDARAESLLGMPLRHGVSPLGRGPPLPTVRLWRHTLAFPLLFPPSFLN